MDDEGFISRTISVVTDRPDSAPAELESLADIGRRLAKQLRDGATSELRVAKEVVKLRDIWGAYKAEAEDLEIGLWLRKYVHATFPFSWYERRAEAASGPFAGIASWLEPEGLVWLTSAGIAPHDVESVKKALRVVYQQNGRKIVVYTQVTRVCDQFVTKARGRERLRAEVAKLQKRVAQLEGFILEAGLVVPVE